MTQTSTGDQQRRTINLRSIALPAEHGAWSFILEPLALGLIMAFSLPGFLFALGLFAGFLIHQPAKIFIKDMRKGKRTQRTRLAGYFAAGYSLAALLLSLPALLSAPAALWWALLIITPLAFIQLAFDFVNKSRDLVPELFGAIALSGTVTLIALVGGFQWVDALVLWVLIGLRAVVSIFFVRTLFRKQRGKPAAVRFTYGLHGLAIFIVTNMAIVWLVPYLAIIPFAVLAWRAWRTLESPQTLKAQTVGIREIFYGIITVVCIAVGYGLHI